MLRSASNEWQERRSLKLDSLFANPNLDVEFQLVGLHSGQKSDPRCGWRLAEASRVRRCSAWQIEWNCACPRIIIALLESHRTWHRSKTMTAICCASGHLGDLLGGRYLQSSRSDWAASGVSSLRSELQGSVGVAFVQLVRIRFSEGSWVVAGWSGTSWRQSNSGTVAQSQKSELVTWYFKASGVGLQLVPDRCLKRLRGATKVATSIFDTW